MWNSSLNTAKVCQLICTTYGVISGMTLLMVVYCVEKLSVSICFVGNSTLWSENGYAPRPCWYLSGVTMTAFGSFRRSQFSPSTTFPSTTSSDNIVVHEDNFPSWWLYLFSSPVQFNIVLIVYEKSDVVQFFVRLGPVQTPNFSWAELNSNLGRPKFKKYACWFRRRT